MKKAIFLFICAGLLILSCQINVTDGSEKVIQNDSSLKAVDENEPILIPADTTSASASASRWPCPGHVSIASIAAAQWGLSSARTSVIADAADYADTYQSGLDNGYNQQWSHAYIYEILFGSTFYLWGDAHEDCYDNINGPQGGEGYNGSYAGNYYNAGNQYTGDQYVGYALHFIQDVSLTLHSTAPTSAGITVSYKTTDMITNHFKFEDWVNANLTAGHRLLDAVAADRSYYAVTDIKQAVKNAAWAACAYKGTSSIGYTAWKEYRNSGYPTGAGAGNATLVDNTKKMLIAAARYSKGLIKYALDKYSQWGSQY